MAHRRLSVTVEWINVHHRFPPPGLSWKFPVCPDPGCSLITWACPPSSQPHPGPGNTEPLMCNELQAMPPYFPTGWEAFSVGCLRAEDDSSFHPSESILAVVGGCQQPGTSNRLKSMKSPVCIFASKGQALWVELWGCPSAGTTPIISDFLNARLPATTCGWGKASLVSALTLGIWWQIILMPLTITKRNLTVSLPQENHCRALRTKIEAESCFHKAFFWVQVSSSWGL